MPSARETFTPRELTDAYEQFKERGPHNMRMPSPASGPQRTGLAPVCSSFKKNLRLAWWYLFIQPRSRGVLRSFSSEAAAWYTKIGLLADAPSIGCLLPWRVIRTVVLPILPGGPFLCMQGCARLRM
jgi:hypothetical protein